MKQEVILKAWEASNSRSSEGLQFGFSVFWEAEDHVFMQPENSFEEANKAYGNIRRRKGVSNCRIEAVEMKVVEAVTHVGHEEDSMMTFKEAAKYLGVIYQQVSNRVARGRMSSFEVGTKLCVRRADVLAWENERADFFGRKVQREFSELK